jgi:hypothetical protein
VIPWWAVCQVPEFDVVNTWNGRTTGPRPEGLNVLLHICKPCNSRLGKKFEEAASAFMKPMIRCQPTDLGLMFLTPAQQVTVGRWVLKTSILRAHAAQFPIPQFLWQWLREGGQPRGMQPPPPGTYIWVAQMPWAEQHVRHLAPADLPDRTLLEYDWSSPMFYFSELAMFVLHQRVVTDEIATHPAEHLDTLARVYPEHDGTVAWPPRQRVGREDLIRITRTAMTPSAQALPLGLTGIFAAEI